MCVARCGKSEKMRDLAWGKLGGTPQVTNASYILYILGSCLYPVCVYTTRKRRGEVVAARATDRPTGRAFER